ncbi:MAG: hypothetical protein MK060_12900 [Blastomonas sp.]|uniref:hypothetical protein n=1 Tax=Blastomonas sp. TaxID=1909299 RepID=UPI00406A714D|nr:hypothetical protein [Blastomonas sp.]
MSSQPRYRPEHRPVSRGSVFVMNTGMTRLTEGDWAIVMPDGTRQRWTPEPRKARA